MLLIAAAIFLSGNYVAPVVSTTCGAGTTAVSNADGTTTCVSDSGAAGSGSTVVIQQTPQPIPVAYGSPFGFNNFYGRFNHVR